MDEELNNKIHLKLQPGQKLNNTIFQAFREDNWLEYKSELDEFEWEDFNKLLGEVRIYSANSHVMLSKMTATAMLTNYPKNLIEYLKDNSAHYPMQIVPNKGIILIDDGPLLVQLVLLGELDPKENTWFRAYADKTPDSEAYKKIFDENSEDPEKTRAYMYSFLQREEVIRYYLEEYDLSLTEKIKFLKSYGPFTDEELAEHVKRLKGNNPKDV
ncbi:MAG: hypothetical protein LBT59_15390 [Clostridiales bacterium]|nr:hypothetical protein [Clostridiales bacterium]